MTVASVPPLEYGTAVAFFGAPAEPPDRGCVVVSPSDPGDEQVLGYDAGTLTISGTDPDVVLTPSWRGDTEGYRYEHGLGDHPDVLFRGGEELVLVGLGGAHVGPFNVSVVAPRAPRVISPTPMEPIQRGDDLVVSWSTSGGGAASDVVVAVTPKGIGFDNQPMEGNGILCSVPDTGTVTIPSQYMSALPAMAGGVIVSVTRVAAAAVSAPGVAPGPDWVEVTFLATNTGGTVANFGW